MITTLFFGSFSRSGGDEEAEILVMVVGFFFLGIWNVWGLMSLGWRGDGGRWRDGDWRRA